jgi:hypothetical protein
MRWHVLRVTLGLIATVAASVTAVLMSSGAAFAAGTTAPGDEDQTPLATVILFASVIGVIILVAVAVVRNRKTLVRRSRRAFRRIARRLSRAE